jgi:hypothetical protein
MFGRGLQRWAMQGDDTGSHDFSLGRKPSQLAKEWMIFDL